MKNLLLEEIEYKHDETALGVWRRFVYPDGQLFEEFISHQWIMGIPLIHYTRGRCPETGKRVVATGVLAFGRMARGVVAVGQASVGIVAVGQLAIGVLFGFGQAAAGTIAIGQLALGGILGIGQFATGLVSIGQIGFGRYVLAQIGYGEAVWDTRGVAPAAKRFFSPFMWK